MKVQTITCRCGSVAVELRGEPIASLACHCDDCQAGARMLAALPDAAPVTDAAGGTPYLHYRKDRVRCTSGAPLLQRLKLRPDSPTNRTVASCCNTPMFVDVDRGLPFWVAVYRDRLGPAAPLARDAGEHKVQPTRPPPPRRCPGLFNLPHLPRRQDDRRPPRHAAQPVKRRLDLAKDAGRHLPLHGGGWEGAVWQGADAPTPPASSGSAAAARAAGRSTRSPRAASGSPATTASPA